MSIPVRRLVNLGLCVLLLLPLASAALADSLDQAKAAGHLGEQADGYLGTPPGAPASLRPCAARPRPSGCRPRGRPGRPVEEELVHATPEESKEPNLDCCLATLLG